MSNKILADIHEITFAIFSIDPTTTIDMNKFPNDFINSNNSDCVELIKNLYSALGKLKGKTLSESARTKVIQAHKSVEDIREYLYNPSREPPIPDIWKSDATDKFWDTSIEIVKCGWTNTESRFNEFVSECRKSISKGGPCPVTKHDNNPSDVVFLIRNMAGEFRILGVSLKATFGEADIGIYNGGVCAFVKIISEMGDLANKKDLCAQPSAKSLIDSIIEPYRVFIDKCNTDPLLKWNTLSNTTEKKDIWKKITDLKDQNSKDLIHSKLVSLSGVRYLLFHNLTQNWKLSMTDNGKTLVSEGHMINDDVFNILGGIYQFSHAAIGIGGVCDVPYLKSTSFIPKEYKKNPVDFKFCSTRVDAPLLSKYVTDDGSPNLVKIETCADVSINLYINNKPLFLIRVKLESVPPSSIKIDISPLKKKSKSKKPTKPKTSKKSNTTPKSVCISEKDIDKMNVPTLKESLKQNGLIRTGNKPELIHRLKVHCGYITSGGGSGNMIVTNDDIFNHIQSILPDLNDDELSILYRLYTDNNCTYNEIYNNDDDIGGMNESDDDQQSMICNDDKPLNNIISEIIQSIDLEYNEELDISLHQRLLLESPIMTRALKLYSLKLTPLNSLRDKLYFLGSKPKKTKKKPKKKKPKKNKTKKKKYK